MHKSGSETGGEGQPYPSFLNGYVNKRSIHPTVLPDWPPIGFTF